MAGDTMLWELCQLSCGECEGACEDDDDFRFKGKKKKDCNWVKRKINKKGFGICNKKVNQDNERIKDFCMTTCEQC
jgi:hypothetical protein